MQSAGGTTSSIYCSPLTAVGARNHHALILSISNKYITLGGMSIAYFHGSLSNLSGKILIWKAHPIRKPYWLGPWAAWSGAWGGWQPCLQQGLKLDGLQSPFQSKPLVILWFYTHQENAVNLISKTMSMLPLQDSFTTKTFCFVCVLCFLKFGVPTRKGIYATGVDYVQW